MTIGPDNTMTSRHCGQAGQHDRHGNLPIDGTYCDGVPRLGPFVELTVRVPLTGHMSMEPATHDEALHCILDEGLGAYIWDMLDEPTTRAALRLRWGGQDRVYPLTLEGHARVPG